MSAVCSVVDMATERSRDGGEHVMADRTWNTYAWAVLRQRVHVLAPRDCTAFVPIGLMDMLRKSIELAARLDATLVSATAERTVALAGGMRLECDAVLSRRHQQRPRPWFRRWIRTSRRTSS
jgi:hypothetical protein